MPEVIIPVNYAQVTWIFSGASLPHGAACTLGLGLGFEPISPPATLVGQLAVDMGDLISAECDGGFSLVETRLKLGPNEDGPTFVSATTEGSAGGAAMAPNVAYLIRKRTLLGGRKNRGRMFLPGVGEAAAGDDGLLSSGKVSAMQVSLDAFFDALITHGADPVILHSDATPPTSIENFEIDGRVATQRRRLRR